MTGLQVFRIAAGAARRVEGAVVELERHLQRLIEANMEEMLGGVRFLASEYSTGPVHRGRIDSLGLDEDGSPVLVEYKRHTSESVISQGLFYMAWLTENRGEFEALVAKRLGPEVAAEVDWTNPRIICIANGFSRYDTAAVGLLHHRIDLMLYQRYEDDLVTLEIAASVAGGCGTPAPTKSGQSTASARRSVSELLAAAPESLQALYADLDARLLDLGEGHSVELKQYIAYRRGRNFACVKVLSSALLVFLRVDPSTVELVPGWTRDVREIGHHGTGGLEVRISSADDLDRAMPLIEMSYAAV